MSTEQLREALGIICGNTIFHGVEPSELVNSLQNGTITELLREAGRSEVRESWRSIFGLLYYVRKTFQQITCECLNLLINLEFYKTLQFTKYVKSWNIGDKK